MEIEATQLFALIPGDGAKLLPEKDWLSFASLVSKLFEVVEKASQGDEKAKTQLKAIHKVIFADSLEVGQSVIEKLACRKGLPRRDAHAWFWFWLTLRIKEVVEPVTGTRYVKLRKGLPEDHPLVRLAITHYKSSGVDTAESIALRAYYSLMDERDIETPTEDNLRDGLKEFQSGESTINSSFQGAVESLRIEGFDFHNIISEKGLNLTLG